MLLPPPDTWTFLGLSASRVATTRTRVLLSAGLSPRAARLQLPPRRRLSRKPGSHLRPHCPGRCSLRHLPLGWLALESPPGPGVPPRPGSHLRPLLSLLDKSCSTSHSWVPIMLVYGPNRPIC